MTLLFKGKTEAMGNDAVKRGVRKWTFIVLGSFFLGLGAIGVVVPLLPTTPFLLLAAACYLRSSEKLYLWLINNRYLGRYIRDYREGKGVPKRIKVVGISLLLLTIGCSAIWATDDLLVRILLAVIAVGVTWHLLSLKTSDTFPREND